MDPNPSGTINQKSQNEDLRSYTKHLTALFNKEIQGRLAGTHYQNNCNIQYLHY